MLLRRPCRCIRLPFTSALHLVIISAIFICLGLLLLPLAQRRSRTDAAQYTLRQKCRGPHVRRNHPSDYLTSYTTPGLFDNIDAQNVPDSLLTVGRPPLPATPKALSDFEEYSHVGTIVLGPYRTQLFNFVRSSFPATIAISKLGQPHEVEDIPLTAKHMASFLLPIDLPESFISPPFPNNIFQTGRESRSTRHGNSLTSLPSKSDNALNLLPPTSEMEIWMGMAPSPSECESTRGPGWNYIYLDDSDAQKFVAEEFNNFSPKTSSLSILDIYRAFAKYQPVMGADLLRYLALAFHGGIYADTDTVCYLPPSMWWHERVHRSQRPSLVIGLEDDAISWRWSKWKHNLARPVQIAQWIMAAAPGHPVVIDSIRRISEKAELLQQERGSLESIKDIQKEDLLNFTGPGVWTDSVLRYLKSRYGMTLDDVRRVTKNRPYRIGDVLILPRKGFHASWKDFVLPSIFGYSDRDIFSEHLGAGSWKKEGFIPKLFRSFSLVWDHMWNMRV